MLPSLFPSLSRCCPVAVAVAVVLYEHRIIVDRVVVVVLVVVRIITNRNIDSQTHQPAHNPGSPPGSGILPRQALDPVPGRVKNGTRNLKGWAQQKPTPPLLLS